MVERQSLTIGPALTYMFEEEAWTTKFGIACLVILASFIVPILPIMILQGYIIEIMRRKARGQVSILPAWDDWGTYLRDGASVVGATLIYSLPLVLVSSCFAVFAIAGAGASADSGSGEVSGIIALAGLCVVCLALLAVIPLGLVTTAGTVRYAETGRFGSFFAFSDMPLLKAENRGRLFTAFLSLFGLSLIGSFIPVLGTAWAYLAGGHIMGQLTRLPEREVSAGPQGATIY